ncbi:hypothetical protein BOQ54_17860 (plasmid) [Chelatococcus daeguensis]|uniref:Uncharacterized protein n=1 Tax=Chelatococcus daeguensis TaxID=444444 RepID=A0AAC9JW13_9HYPH|nr:hypothetical protein BOQ54_17860 [Chelatococcus daeguensis]
MDGRDKPGHDGGEGRISGGNVARAFLFLASTKCHGAPVLRRDATSPTVMPALVAGIHALERRPTSEAWMAGTSPAITRERERLFFG